MGGMDCQIWKTTSTRILKEMVIEGRMEGIGIKEYANEYQRENRVGKRKQERLKTLIKLWKTKKC